MLLSSSIINAFVLIKIVYGISVFLSKDKSLTISIGESDSNIAHAAKYSSILIIKFNMVICSF